MIQPSLFDPPRGRQEIIVPAVLDAVLMRPDAALFISISGGKDGQAMLKALVRMHRARGWRCAVFVVHAHLGRAEWRESLPHCHRIAAESGLSLIVVRRPQGDLVQEIEERKNKLAGSGRSPWPTATERYCTADQKRDQLQKEKRQPQPFWPDAANRYCTADQKRSQIDRVVRAAARDQGAGEAREGAPFWPSAASRYCTDHQKSSQIDKVLRPYKLVVSAMGMRAQESTDRAKKPAFRIDATLTAKVLRELAPGDAFDAWDPNGKHRLAFDWLPVHDWTVDEVWAEIGTSAKELALRRRAYAAGHHADALDGWPAHPAYVYGNERVSCALCVLASRNDLAVGARHNPELFRLYVSWEEETGFTFQHKRALSSVAPELLIVQRETATCDSATRSAPSPASSSAASGAAAPRCAPPPIARPGNGSEPGRDEKKGGCPHRRHPIPTGTMFKEIRPILATGRPVMVSICLQPDGRILAAVIPEALEADEKAPAPEVKAALCAPCTLVGTAEELDEMFPQCLTGYTASHLSLAQTVAEVQEQMAEAERAAKAAADAKRKKGGAAGVTASRTTVLVQTETAPADPSLFDTPPEPAAASAATETSDPAAATAASA